MMTKTTTTRTNISTSFRNISDSSQVKWKFNFFFIVQLVVPLMIFATGQRAPFLWALKPCWKITSFGRWRSSECHYSWANLTMKFIRDSSHSILSQKYAHTKFDSCISHSYINTSALSRPLHVASPDWANLYSASFDVSSRISNKSTHTNTIKWFLIVLMAIIFGCTSINIYGSIDYLVTWFSRTQSIDIVPHSKQHDDEIPDLPNILNYHRAKWPSKWALQLKHRKNCRNEYKMDWNKIHHRQFVHIQNTRTHTAPYC